mgnify:CR=1 FL=1
MIRLDHVYKGFNGNAVLEDISLALPEKGFCAITGRSGRGKTTLLYLIAGLYKPDRGSIQRRYPFPCFRQQPVCYHSL